MFESYRVGVQIAISGDIGQIIGQLIKDFEKLDQAVNGTKENLSGLTDAMKGMAASGKSAADAWQNVAKSIGAAAKAAKEAAASSASIQPRQSRGQAQSASQAQAAINAAVIASSAQRGAPTGTSLVPYTGGAYQRGRYSDPTSGPTIGLPYQSSGTGMIPYVPPRPAGGYPMAPYDYEGEIIPPERPAPTGGPSRSAQGPTINGTWTRPGGSGQTWGPYGPGGTGMGGQYSPNVPAVGGGGGFPPAVGGAGGAGGGYPPGMPPLNLPPGMYHQYQPGRAPSLHDFNGMAMLPEIAGFDWMKENWEKSAAYQAEQAHLIQQGFTPGEARAAGNEAMQVQREVGPITAESVLHIVDKLMNVTQQKDIATNPQILTEYAKAAVVLSSYGRGDELHELDSAIRAGEFRGVLTHEGKNGKQEIDVEGMSQFLRQLTAMASISGGDIGPSQVLGMLRAAGAAGSIITPDELTRMMALIIASGRTRAGSNLQAFEQQFTAGRMSEAAANLLIGMNIIQGGGDARHNPYLKKSGMGQFLMLPGAMTDQAQEEAAKEPSMFIMQTLLPKFQEQIRKTFGSRYDLGSDKDKLVYESKYAQMVASRIGGGVEMTEVIRNILLMQRDVAAALKNMQLDNYKIQMDDNPQNAAKSMGAAYGSLQTLLGTSTMGPATTAITGLTSALTGLSTWASTPTGAYITKVGMEALAGALVALGAVGLVALAGTLGGVTGAFVALGAGTAVAVEGIKQLDEWLHKTFGWLIGSNADVEKTQQSIKQHGVEIPWWMPLPAFGAATKEPAPKWAQWWRLFSMGGAFGGEPSAPGTGGKPAAPLGPLSDSPKGTANDPLVVHVQNQTTGQDIARGTTSYQASKMTRPPSGYTGTDTRIDPLGAFYGMVTSPN